MNRELKRTVAAGLVAGLFVSCGGPVADVLTDAMTDMSMSDAEAQDCGSCTASGALRIMTADTDPSRIEGGTLRNADSWEEVIQGPFILTDVEFERENSVQFRLADAGLCGDGDRFVDVDSQHAPMTSGRWFVPSGRVLCAEISSGVVYWSGFRPYE